MNRSLPLALPGTLLAAAALALTTPHASAAPTARTAAPEGYVREHSFPTAAQCRSTGTQGVAQGRWTAYACVQELPFTPSQTLFVKN
ncbi:hypothetical protein [Streptomyces bambusae]|uniref:Uncharacterized protein n=1 Tax=Streptomyces bambusae TaxID=1550616 RepID=A0ABS6ZGN7_9ACTN|nr:hypothetical protein [Streptomyces bambusae]MBW5486926.1 hypothetical protein [Streptomyces bambusae]